jgi:RNAse (barnase) inhibitor barstar
MQDWNTIFSSFSNSGVYGVEKRSNVRQTKKAALINGLDYICIDLKNSLDKSSFLKTVADALQFPAYFGMNWDALSDFLTDLSWKKAIGCVIVFISFNTIYENMAADVKIIKNIFESTALYWKQNKVQFYIILSV